MATRATGDRFDVLAPAVRSRLRREEPPDWVGPMLATLTDRRFSDPDWIFERKLDGERCLAFGSAGGVVLKSRNANIVTEAYPEIAAALKGSRTVDDFVVDGEIVAFVDDQTSFQQLQRRIHLRAPDRIAASMVPVFYYLFDVVHVDGFDVSDVPLVDRKRLLRSTFRFADPLRLSADRTD